MASMSSASAVARERGPRRSEVAKAARRDEILAAARAVFAERGFRGTTIADIAERAGVALGTVYLYFDSKEEVFAALNDQLMALISEALAEAPEQRSLEEAVQLRVANVFRACDENRDLVRLAVLNIDPESPTRGKLRAADAERERPMVAGLRRLMDAGLVRAADPAVMIHLIRGLVSSAVYTAYVLRDGRDAGRYRDECARMIAAYMAPQTEPDQAAGR